MSESALVGRFARGPINLPVKVDARSFEQWFSSAEPTTWPAEVQARQFFANGGGSLFIVRIPNSGALAEELTGEASKLSGLHALQPISDLRLLIAPEISLLPSGEFESVFNRFSDYLEPRRIFFILDPPPHLTKAAEVVEWVQAFVPANSSLCALYFPYLEVMLDRVPLTIGASGAMAATYTKSDTASGIWRSPAGTSLPLQVEALQPALAGNDFDFLNANHINVIRDFSGTGIIPFGSRTLDRSNPENRYIAPVRARNWIAASIERALALAAVEDNGPPLWTQIRSLTETFLFSLYQQGAFAGSKPEEAFFVRCDASTTTSADIAAHRVNLLYGIALARPAEFDLTLLSASTYDAMRSAAPALLYANAFAGDLVMAYATVAGFDYVLEAKSSLEDSHWRGINTLFGGNGAWRRQIFSTEEGSYFYRLKVTRAR